MTAMQQIAPGVLGKGTPEIRHGSGFDELVPIAIEHQERRSGVRGLFTRRRHKLHQPLNGCSFDSRKVSGSK